MSFKVLKEHPTHFEVERKDGTKLTVPKRGLSKATLTKIQNFASGGSVAPAIRAEGATPSGHHPDCSAHGGEAPCDHPNCCARMAEGGEVSPTNEAVQSLRQAFKTPEAANEPSYPYADMAKEVANQFSQAAQHLPFVSDAMKTYDYFNKVFTGEPGTVVPPAFERTKAAANQAAFGLAPLAPKFEMSPKMAAQLEKELAASAEGAAARIKIDPELQRLTAPTPGIPATPEQARLYHQFFREQAMGPKAPVYEPPSLPARPGMVLAPEDIKMTPEGAAALDRAAEISRRQAIAEMERRDAAALPAPSGNPLVIQVPEQLQLPMAPAGKAEFPAGKRFIPGEIGQYGPELAGKLKKYYADGGEVDQKDTTQDYAQGDFSRPPAAQPPVVVNVNQAPQGPALTPSHPVPAPVAWHPATPREAPAVPLQSVNAPMAAPVPGALPPSFGQPAPEPTAAPQVPSQAAPAAPSQPRGPAIPGLPKELAGYQKEYDAGLATTKGALDAQKQAELEQGAELARQQQEKAAYLKAHTDQTNALVADWKQKSDTMRQDILDDKIDPNRIFHEMGTGRSIGAAIAVALGGIGQGLMVAAGAKGATNPAMDVINKAIDRDIDAQRFNITKKMNTYRMYMDQFRDEMAARMAVKADYLDTAAAQVDATKAKYGSKIDAARLDQLSGQLQMQASQFRLEAAQRVSTLKLQGIQMAQGVQGLQLGQYQLRAAGRQEQAIEAFGSGQPFNPLALPKEISDRVVTLPTGRKTLAQTEEDAKAVKEGQTTLQQARDTLKDMIEYRKEENGGRLAPAALSTRTAQGKALRDKLAVDLTELAKHVGRGNKVLQMMANQIPDPTELMLPGNWEKWVDQVNRGLNESEAALYNNRLGSHISGRTTERKPGQ